MSVVADVLQWLNCITGRFSACQALEVLSVSIAFYGGVLWEGLNVNMLKENFVKIL